MKHWTIDDIESLLGKIDIQSAYPDLWEDTACDIIRQLIKERNALREGIVCLQAAIRLAINDGIPTTNDILTADKIAQDALDFEANRLAGEVK